MSSFNITKHAFARERITVTNGGVSVLTPATYNDNTGGVGFADDGSKRRKASGARLALEPAAGDIHFSEDGTAPTSGTTGADVGTIAGARDLILLESYEAIAKFKAIALSATNAIIEVVYYR